MGLFQSINPMIKYHPGKANIVTDALSRSQRSSVDKEKIEETTFASLFTLTTHMEMDQGEHHEWVIAYEANPRLRAVLRNLW